MKLKTDKFCNLATSPSWQAWLFHFDQDIYRKFIKQLQESRNCSQNRDIMLQLLAEIDKIPDGNKRLFDFISANYPHMLVGVAQPRSIQESDVIFEHYNPNILTYPRRLIMTGESRRLQSQIREFLLDKIQSDYIIMENKAYVEYLTAADAAIRDKIPQANWQIAKWRLRQ